MTVYNPGTTGGGGTTAANDTIYDAKGDVVVGTGADTAVRKAVGSDGQVFTADAASAGGVKWAATGWNPQPSDFGMVTWSFDIAVASSGATVTAATLYVGRVPVREATTFVNAAVVVTTAGTGGTALLDCYLGLYDMTGVLRGKTADQATPWATVGYKTAALVAESGQNLTIAAADKWAYVGLLVGTMSTTPVQFSRQTSATTTPNLGQTGATTPPARFLKKAAAGPPLPSPITFSGYSLDSGFWYGLS